MLQLLNVMMLIKIALFETRKYISSGKDEGKKLKLKAERYDNVLKLIILEPHIE